MVPVWGEPMQRATFSTFPPERVELEGSWQPFRFRLTDGAGTNIEMMVVVPIHASHAAMVRMAYDAMHRALAAAAADTAERKLPEAERILLRTGLPPGAK